MGKPGILKSNYWAYKTHTARKKPMKSTSLTFIYFSKNKSTNNILKRTTTKKSNLSSLKKKIQNIKIITIFVFWAFTTS
jgi:hypothetical protein